MNVEQELMGAREPLNASIALVDLFVAVNLDFFITEQIAGVSICSPKNPRN